jgi:hypothetical protein
MMTPVTIIQQRPIRSPNLFKRHLSARPCSRVRLALLYVPSSLLIDTAPDCLLVDLKLSILSPPIYSHCLSCSTFVFFKSKKYYRVCDDLI